MSTSEILIQLKAVDDRIVDQAFTYLYREYYPVIRSFITDNSGSEEDAADVFQDSLIVLYDKVRDKNFELRCTPKTLIYSISKNLWLKKLTGRKKNIQKKEAFKTIPLDPNIAEVLEDDEQSVLVAKLLKQIGGDAEKLLIYFFFDGLKTDEVTKKMGFANEQVTRNKKSRTLKKLRELLQASPILKDLLP